MLLNLRSPIKNESWRTLVHKSLWISKPRKQNIKASTGPVWLHRMHAHKAVPALTFRSMILLSWFWCMVWSFLGWTQIFLLHKFLYYFNQFQWVYKLQVHHTFTIISKELRFLNFFSHWVALYTSIYLILFNFLQ